MNEFLQDKVFLLDILEICFNRSSYDFWEFLVSEEIQVPTRTPLKTNN